MFIPVRDGWVAIAGACSASAIVSAQLQSQKSDHADRNCGLCDVSPSVITLSSRNTQLNHSFFHLFFDVNDVGLSIVFRPGVLNVVAAEGYGTLVVIVQRDAIANLSPRNHEALPDVLLQSVLTTGLDLRIVQNTGARILYNKIVDLLLDEILLLQDVPLVFLLILHYSSRFTLLNPLESNIMDYSRGGTIFIYVQSSKFMKFLFTWLENQQFFSNCRFEVFFGSTLGQYGIVVKPTLSSHKQAVSEGIPDNEASEVGSRAKHSNKRSGSAAAKRI
ncbi:hypothetical protein Tco_0129089 [Tanacetum coccineum]